MEHSPQRHPSPAPSKFTLYFSYWRPAGESLNLCVDGTEVSSVEDVFHLRELIAQSISTNAITLHLYKIPDNSPLPLKDMGITKISLSDLGQPLTINLSLASVFGSPPAAHHLHLVVVNSCKYHLLLDSQTSTLPPQLIIRYWIRGSSLKFGIKLEVPRGERVIDLISAVQEKSEHLRSVSLEKLELYKFSHSKQEDISEIIQGTGLGYLLPKNEMLETVFNDVPINEKPCVIVEVVVSKDKHLLDWDVADRASKKTKIAPSDVGPSEYYEIQRQAHTRFIDHRPVKIETQDEFSNQSLIPDKELPPLEVLYTGFGEFLDTYRAERESKVIGRSVAKVRHEIEVFAEEMTQVYTMERSRQSVGLRRLNNILFDSPRPVIVPSDIDGTTTDGHYVHGQFQLPCFIVKFENENAKSKAIPSIQLASYYQRSVVAVENRCRELVYCSRLPALGVTIIGPVITFYAMVWVGSVVCYPLTPGISCVFCATGGDDRRALHGAFVAARDLVARIEKDAKKLSEKTSPRLSKHSYPDLKELPSFLDSHVSVSFQITDVLQSGHGRILYRAQSTRPPGLDLVIKFTRSYSADLHNFCASRGRAPIIHGIKKLPGNIVVIAMEYLWGDYLGPEGSQELRDKMAKQLKQLVEEFHNAGYVHGDLRLPNIYCVKDEIKLLDFDWGGKVGEVSYPYQILNCELTEGRDMDNLMITKEDDERVLKMTLESIGCS